MYFCDSIAIKIDYYGKLIPSFKEQFSHFCKIWPEFQFHHEISQSLQFGFKIVISKA